MKGTYERPLFSCHSFKYDFKRTVPGWNLIFKGQSLFLSHFYISETLEPVLFNPDPNIRFYSGILQIEL
jgi:hypothetical protein